jgi:hypothetical protein
MSPLQTKCNIDADFRAVFFRWTKSTLGRFPVIWGDFGGRFTRKSRAENDSARTFTVAEERCHGFPKVARRVNRPTLYTLVLWRGPTSSKNGKRW